MTEVYLQLGVGGILVVLVLKEVFEFIKKTKNSNSQSNSQCGWKEKYTEAKHDELRDLIISVNENISAQTNLLTELYKEVVNLKNKLN